MEELPKFGDNGDFARQIQENVMKCSELVTGVGDAWKTAEEQMAAFTFEEAETPLRKIFIALTKEQTWSNDYLVKGQFCNGRGLGIWHPLFAQRGELWIPEKDITTETTVRDIETVVRDYLKGALDLLRGQMTELQQQAAELSAALSQIDVLKAKAAIIAVFPEAADSTHFAPYGRKELTIFFLQGFEKTIFVARETEQGFVDPVKINISATAWVANHEPNRYELYWAEIAREFAAKTLSIDSKRLHTAGVRFVELAATSWEPLHVIFTDTDEWVSILVEFEQMVPISTQTYHPSLNKG